MMLTVGGEGERRLNVLYRKLRVICDDFVVGHPCGQPAEDVIDRDAHVPDTWLAASFSRFDGDALTVVFHKNHDP